MNILAIDASTTHCGFTFAINDRFVECGEFVPVGETPELRTLNYSCWLDGMIIKDNITTLCYERPSGSHGSMKINIMLGGLRYATWFVCHDIGVNFVEVSPAQVKATGCCKVWNKKTKVINSERLEIARLYYPFEIILKSNGTINGAAMSRQDDIIDSIGIWLACLEKIEWRKDHEMDS